MSSVFAATFRNCRTSIVSSQLSKRKKVASTSSLPTREVEHSSLWRRSPRNISTSILALMLKGTLFTVQKALPLMPSGGSIVINGSMVSIKGIPAFGVYAATKAALRSFARTWAVDLKGRNIRVNVIAPGTIVTPGYKSELGLSDEQIEGFKAEAAAATPLGRTGLPEEVAAAVLFLASDESSYVNGIELFVDAEPRRSEGPARLYTSIKGSAFVLDGDVEHHTRDANSVRQVNCCWIFSGF